MEKDQEEERNNQRKSHRPRKQRKLYTFKEKGQWTEENVRDEHPVSDDMEYVGRSFWDKHRKGQTLKICQHKLGNWAFYPAKHGNSSYVKKYGTRDVHYAVDYQGLGALVTRFGTDIDYWPEMKVAEQSTTPPQKNRSREVRVRNQIKRSRGECSAFVSPETNSLRDLSHTTTTSTDTQTVNLNQPSSENPQQNTKTFSTQSVPNVKALVSNYENTIFGEEHATRSTGGLQKRLQNLEQECFDKMFDTEALHNRMNRLSKFLNGNV